MTESRVSQLHTKAILRLKARLARHRRRPRRASKTDPLFSRFATDYALKRERLPELCGRESGRAAVLRVVRRCARSDVRHPAAQPSRRASASAATADRPLTAAAPAAGCRHRHRAAEPRDRAAPRLRPLRRPGRLHGALGVPRRGGGARAPVALLRHLPPADRALRRHGREVHRRRGDGGVGHAGRDRGRRRARGAGRARPGRGRLRARAGGRRRGAAGPCRGADRRGGCHARRPRARGWSRATSSTPRRGCSRWPSPGRCSSARRPAGRPSGRSSTRTPGTLRAEGQGGRDAALAKALRVVSGVRGALKSQGLEAPFVGRDRELRQIKDLFHVSADERKAQLVSVTGIAGIGKSRLAVGVLQVLRRHRADDLLAPRPLPRLRRGSHLLGARRHGADALPDRRGRRPVDGAATKLQAALEELILDAGGAPLRGAAARAAARSRRARDARPPGSVRRLAAVLRAARRDLSDGARVRGHAVGRRVAARLRRVPARVVAQPPDLRDHARPAGARSSGGRPGGPGTATSPRSTSSRSRRRRWRSSWPGSCPGLPAALRDQILDRAEGVPLYAVETVRMLLDRGLLVEEGSAYRRVGEIELARGAGDPARADRCPPRRPLARRAAAAPATPPCWARRSRRRARRTDRDRAAQLDALLAASCARRCSGCNPTRARPEHGQYGFLQDMLRHVAYETLPKRERRAKHLAAAEQLSGASLAEDEVAEVVASHLLEAYRLDSGRRRRGDDLRAKAREALVARRRAGRLARRLGRGAALLRAGGRARRRAAGSAAMLSARVRWPGWPRVRRARRRRSSSRRWRCYEEVGDTHAAARASSWLGLVEQILGRIEQAIERMERAYDGHRR